VVADGGLGQEEFLRSATEMAYSGQDQKCSQVMKIQGLNLYYKINLSFHNDY